MPSLLVTHQWEQRALDVEELWFKTRVAECTEYSKLA